MYLKSAPDCFVTIFGPEFEKRYLTGDESTENLPWDHPASELILRPSEDPAAIFAVVDSHNSRTIYRLDSYVIDKCKCDRKLVRIKWRMTWA